jgi:hypothetical protein
MDIRGTLNDFTPPGDLVSTPVFQLFRLIVNIRAPDDDQLVRVRTLFSKIAV